MMFRSPISPASVWTSRRNSSRSAISSGDNRAATETFVPGIRTPNHQSSAIMTATALTIRRQLNKMRRHISAEFFPKTESAEREQRGAHRGKDDKRRPKFGEAGAT